MRNRNYEKSKLLTVIITVFMIIEISASIILFNTKRFSYQKISGIVIKNDLITIIASYNERKNLYKNKRIYLNNKVFSYTIEEDRGFILKKNNIKYYEIIIKTNKRIKDKLNDNINISIRNEKKQVFKMIKDIWVGDNN